MLAKIWADGSYIGPLAERVKERFDADLEVVKRSDDVKGFVVLPRRWVVERTFAWLGRCRRLSRDYKLLPQHDCHDPLDFAPFSNLKLFLYALIL